MGEKGSEWLRDEMRSERQPGDHAGLTDNCKDSDCCFE